ncbi:MAG: peptide ABC transporter substrate-binding protein [Gaiellaceae bacterium]
MRRPSLVAALVGAVVAVASAAGTSAGTPARGGTVVIAIESTQEWACLRFFDSACTGSRGSLVAARNLVLQGAFELRPGFAFRPNLVSGMDVLARSPLTVRYRIRREARWSDRTPFTASDVLFTLDVCRSAGRCADVQSAKAVDEKTVIAEFRTPFPYQDAEPFFPAHALRGVDPTIIWGDRIDNPRTGAAIGSGPFLVEDWKRGKELVLRRNRAYWGPHPAYVERVVFRFFRAEDLAGAIRRGDADLLMGGSSVQRSAIVGLRRRPPDGVRIVSRPGVAWEHLDFRLARGGHPALRRAVVRRAIAFGLDRVAIAREAARLAGEKRVRAIEPLNSAVVLTNSRYYRANWSDYRHRPALARRLLEQAGCRRSAADGIYSCAGERLALRLFTTAESTPRRRRAELIQAQLRAIGVEVVPQYAPLGTLLGQVLPAGDWDLALFAWEPTDPQYVRFLDAIWGCGGLENWTGYCRSSVTDDLRASASTVNADERARLLHRADRRLAREVPGIPLFQARSLSAVSARLHGFVPNPGGDPTWNAEDWSVER